MESKRDDVYAEAFHHFIWATKGRQPMITASWEARLHGYIRKQCVALGVEVHALNGMPDHIHLACSLPPKLSAADCMHKVKGSSSHFINHLPEIQTNGTLCLYWQPGYGMLTFSKKDLPRVVSYVDGQKTHHAIGRLWEKLERSSSLIYEAFPGRSPAFQRRG